MTEIPEPWPCAYGENAWQAPAQLVHEPTDDPVAIGRFVQLEGSALSYNNLAELDRQLQTITHIAATFDLAGESSAMAVGTKHGNACGACSTSTIPRSSATGPSSPRRSGTCGSPGRSARRAIRTP